MKRFNYDDMAAFAITQLSLKVPSVVTGCCQVGKSLRIKYDRMKNVFHSGLFRDLKSSDKSTFKYFSHSAPWGKSSKKTKLKIFPPKFNYLRPVPIMSVISLIIRSTENYCLDADDPNDQFCHDAYIYGSQYLSNVLTNDLFLEEFPFALNLQQLFQVVPTIMLWASTVNVTASPHYDMEHNFFLQVYGNKVFTITSPDAYDVFRPTASLHPEWRQGIFENLTDKRSIVDRAILLARNYQHRKKSTFSSTISPPPVSSNNYSIGGEHRYEILLLKCFV